MKRIISFLLFANAIITWRYAKEVFLDIPSTHYKLNIGNTLMYAMWLLLGSVLFLVYTIKPNTFRKNAEHAICQIPYFLIWLLIVLFWIFMLPIGNIMTLAHTTGKTQVLLFYIWVTLASLTGLWVTRKIFNRAFFPLVSQGMKVAFAIERPLVILLVVYLLLWLPTIARLSDSPLMLNTSVEDESVQTQELVAMSFPPYGNPSTLMEEPKLIPKEWGPIHYNFIYYGGFYLGLGFIIWLPFHWLGFPLFPITVLILRSISLLSGAACIIVIYNFGKRISGRYTGFVAGAILVADNFFSYYSSIAHPDTLQILLVLLAIWVALCHVQQGDLYSLVGMGTLAGLVQGTKNGGVWLVPMAVVALVWGLSKTDFPGLPLFKKVKMIVARLALLGTVAALLFMVSTPYAFMDDFYFTRWIWAARFFQTPTVDTSPGAWLTQLNYYQGDWLFYLTLTTMCVLAVRTILRKAHPALILAAIVWFTTAAWVLLTVRYWINLGNALPVLVLSGLLVGEFLCWTYAAIPKSSSLVLRVLTAALICVVPVIGIVYRGYPQVPNYALSNYLDERCTNVALNDWARGHLPKQAKILVDGLAYINPVDFPNYVYLGEGITYSFMDHYKPEYIVLSPSLYKSMRYTVLRQNQHYTRGTEGIASVLFYQDLLDRGGIEGIELAGSVEGVSQGNGTCAPNDLRKSLQLVVSGKPSILGDPVLVYRVDPLFYDKNY